MPAKRPDRLSSLIRQFRIEARVQPRHGLAVPGEEPRFNAANFFVVRGGRIRSSDGRLLNFADGSQHLVFFPRGMHAGARLAPESETGAYVRAVVDAGGAANPIALALPDLVTVSLDAAPSLRAVTDVLLDEALNPRCGGKAVIDRLCEVVIIRLLRHLIEAGQAKTGLLAGLAHPNLSLAIVAIHDRPDKAWRLEDLAACAGMSRTHFANTFRAVVGITPGEYLSNWRLTLARAELAKGKPLKTVARRAGFSSSAALSRAFSRRYGVSPRRDRLAHRPQDAASGEAIS